MQLSLKELSQAIAKNLKKLFQAVAKEVEVLKISSRSVGSSVISKGPLSNIDRDFSTRNIASDYHVKFDFTENNTCITYLEFGSNKDPMKSQNTYGNIFTPLHDFYRVLYFEEKNLKNI